ncbi:probable two-component sensor [Fulvimarina pelagi HTCC2506]|uniref:histidine kinase n=2 Tax=Fulvimarina pelagi TaxID=217511 RepID=Q0FYA2_9HYPH|nr:hybrid sensor histidine kinase/response regulator [Fulvimarina pelagi]EAU40093.1 probable two-component sensor [Fulvimarina pelagi HTCC2506]BAT31131.1 probable two-component sensor [Fulvimarina pelagi]
MNEMILGTLGTISADDRPEPDCPEKEEIWRLKRINLALMRRIEQVTDSQANAYSLFQTAIQRETQVRRRTEELSDALKTLEETNRKNLAAREAADNANRSKSKFLAAASHDILQPLNAARLSLFAVQGSGLSPEGERFASAVDRALDTMEDLIGSVLEIARLDAGVLEPDIGEIALSDLCVGLATEFQPLAREKGLSLRATGSDLTGLSDAALLRRLLANLLSNAIRYTDKGGVLVGARRRGDSVRIDVVDTGHGIAADQYEKIFEEFHRGRLGPKSSTARPGLGLGLSIVKRTAAALGHRLSFRSREGRGTVFSVSMPLAPVQHRQDKPASPRVQASGIGLAYSKVLLVENEKAVTEATVALLERWSCTVRTASGISEAQTILAQEKFYPDVVIADYWLDKGQIGTDVVEAVRSTLGRNVPACVLTADYAAETEEHIQKSGCELIRKPVRPAELRALLAHMTA